MPDKTVTEFCAAKNISRSSYFALRKRGLGPDETVYPGTRIKRITEAAEQAWDARMAELAKGEAAKLEAERRRVIATVAGRIAAQSAKHVSHHRGAHSTSRRPRRTKNLLDQHA